MINQFLDFNYSWVKQPAITSSTDFNNGGPHALVVCVKVIELRVRTTSLKVIYFYLIWFTRWLICYKTVPYTLITNFWLITGKIKKGGITDFTTGHDILNIKNPCLVSRQFWSKRGDTLFDLLIIWPVNLSKLSAGHEGLHLGYNIWGTAATQWYVFSQTYKYRKKKKRKKDRKKKMWLDNNGLALLS